ncbi:glycosyltransferase family A protein [Wenxinia marina]|uniref:Glycosyltransferase 2-like domain-containing protein n=1 Tax=Wenxinia marina DSM 24838 TaxID=1123501 RepID=A0A0D0PJ27_9RHOB|nr:glycosyltransferase family A protein [Wenxinia marina]KIQ71416.1 hypothetical protein Wenmar_04062 [Wenxinia marina DSM 24838]GGL78831.1 hypothetical protein GCM10011392_36630 [Wenxinia marina]
MTAALPEGPVLPPHLAGAMAAAADFAGFLRRTGFDPGPDGPVRRGVRLLDEARTLAGLAAARARLDADPAGPLLPEPAPGLAGLARALVRLVHSSPAFDAHAGAQPDGIRVPRLRALVPPLPPRAEAERQIAAALEAALAAAARGAGPDIDAVLGLYLAPETFAETRMRGDHVADLLFAAQPARALDLIARGGAGPEADGPAADESAPAPWTAPLLRAGCRHFARSRAYGLARDLGERHLALFGPGPELFGALWHAASRSAPREEARPVLDLWEAEDPLDPRQIIARAVFEMEEDPAEGLEILADGGAEDGISTPQGHALFVEAALAQGRTRRAERALRRALAAAERDGAAPPDACLVALHNLGLARGRPNRALAQVLARQGTILDPACAFGLDTLRERLPTPRLATFPSGADTPPVGIVMPAFRAARWIGRAIAGVLGQSHPGLTLHVVDDGSDDGTADIARRVRDPRIRVHALDGNRGAYGARNHGIRAALEEGVAFVGFCDADDLWLRDHLACHLAAMAERPDALWSVSRWLRVDPGGRVECGPTGVYADICPHSQLFRAEAFDMAGLYDPVRFGADREFETRLAYHAGPGARIVLDRILTLGRRHDASLTMSGPGAIDPQGRSAVRLAYWEAWNAWHLDALRRGAPPRLDPAEGAPRPFAVPEALVAAPAAGPGGA